MVSLVPLPTPTSPALSPINIRLQHRHRRIWLIELARILNVKTTTLSRWRWAGIGPRFIKIGGAVRYAESEIQEFIEAGIRTSTSDGGPRSLAYSMTALLSI
jgi:predicted DNA-binding transcriptional regulator AlpA